jgi:hypothetical protein
MIGKSGNQLELGENRRGLMMSTLADIDEKAAALARAVKELIERSSVGSPKFWQR